ncbi:MAG: hypothetical protein CM15mP74_00040 [Halieaceae bacterium]|nr:MAG: hypothetical protein CM15mP74_00040 [Halieaceae bacterium]
MKPCWPRPGPFPPGDRGGDDRPVFSILWDPRASPPKKWSFPPPLLHWRSTAFLNFGLGKEKGCTCTPPHVFTRAPDPRAGVTLAGATPRLHTRLFILKGPRGHRHIPGYQHTIFSHHAAKVVRSLPPFRNYDISSLELIV